MTVRVAHHTVSVGTHNSSDTRAHICPYPNQHPTHSNTNIKHPITMPGLMHPDTQACEAISTRLSTLQELRLPAALLRDHPYPEATAVQQHLQQLLQRDAVVFLEVGPDDQAASPH